MLRENYTFPFCEAHTQIFVLYFLSSLDTSLQLNNVYSTLQCLWSCVHNQDLTAWPEKVPHSI